MVPIESLAILSFLAWILIGVRAFRPSAYGGRMLYVSSRRGVSMAFVDPGVDRKVLRRVAGEQFSLVCWASNQNEAEGVRSIYSLTLTDSKGSAILNARVGHKTNGPVPRSAATSMLVLEASNPNQQFLPGTVDENAVVSLVEECLRWYLDSGGRIGKLVVAAPAASEDVLRALQSMGFHVGTSNEAALAGPFSLAQFYPSASVFLTADGRKLLQYVQARAKQAKPKSADLFTLHDVAGRLFHDLGEPKNAIEPYTSALIANPASAGAFRNLGSAYQAVGNSQMAFASFQQAIQLDPSDALVYLKLAYFYEDFATKDWVDAADHAMRCYIYYLENVDREDTAVLTRLGNLQVREHRSQDAIDTFSKALRIDDSAANVWFNKAHAQMQIGDVDGARESLTRTIKLDPTISAAAHMLKALTPQDAQKVDRGDDKYVKELFDSYSSTYDPHVKKLMYSAPRVIRQEMAKIYRGRFTIDNAEEEVPSQLPSQTPGCTTIIPTISINSTLDVLDLGCGTGLAGAWLKDYARHLVGVDLSEQMITIARKKMLYQELAVMSISTYLQQCTRKFDLVVAADVLSYIGDLKATFAQLLPTVNPGGHFCFTVEAVEGNKDAPTQGEKDPKGYTLLKNGRFGYSLPYLENIIQTEFEEKGFTKVVSRSFSPRLDAGTAVPGYIYILHRTTT